MANPIHVHSQFDAQARAIAIVEEVEREALDEDMVAGTLQAMAAVFMDRVKRSSELINEARTQQIKDARSERLRKHEKGVQPQAPHGDKKLLTLPRVG